MSEHQLHPSTEELTAFSLGQLPSQNAAKIESHISECEPCCETLLGLSNDDTFVDILKDTKKVDDGISVDLSDSGETTDGPAGIPSALAEHPRYGIVGLIAKGGMGDVFKAEHRMMERTVALKVIKQELMRKPEAVERFHREVRTAAKLSHPNIVTSHDAEQAGDVHFLAMEYVAGVDLAGLVKEHGPLSVADSCDYIRQAAVGLQYAYEQGMVHRDIKPHNLMVSGEGTVKILDFGLASLAVGSYMAQEVAVQKNSELTATGTIMGTPDYIAPEQADDSHQADIRSDIYSLGATMYYLLSGKAPFSGGSVLHKLRSHALADPEPIEAVRNDIPAELAEIMRRMMAKIPGERFQTPVEVADALAGCAVQPLTELGARKPQSHTKHSEPPVRYRLLLAAGLAGFFVLLVAAVFYIKFGKTTLRFEISDPSVSVSFDDEAINVSTPDKKEFRVVPGTEQKFKIYQNGTEVETHTLTLRRGQKVVLKIDVVAGQLKIDSDDPNIYPKRLAAAQTGKPALPGGNATAGSSSQELEWCVIPAGAFEMGTVDRDIAAIAPEEDWFFARFVPKRRKAEKPQHEVTISKPFEMSKHEVTVGQFRQFVEETGYKTTSERTGEGYGWRNGEWREGATFSWRDPGFKQADNHPVCNVSWEDAVAFCDWLSSKQGKKCRLPSEAEWEYACRGGATTLFSTGDDPKSLQGAANLADSTLREQHGNITWNVEWSDGFVATAPVGSFKPNAFGLHDMHGNVWEWCQDVYDDEWYQNSPNRDPLRRGSTVTNVFRGGGFDNWPGFLRSADRYSSHSPTLRSQWAGFRVVREVDIDSAKTQNP
jgi:formylglycine-generating enzyme required for sulfatase activity/serine/threonine protein kinase